MLLTGAVLALMLALQLWRTVGLEAKLQQAEVARARLLGERILQRAVTLPAVFAAAQRSVGGAFLVRGGQVVVDDEVGWLYPVGERDDEDPVVLDRLERVARAEFLARDPVAAALQFEELLAGPLPTAQRLQVLAAAAFQAQRADDDVRRNRYCARLRLLVAEVQTAQLARPTVANAVAAAARLGERALTREQAERLLPCLPDLPFAALSVTDDVRRRHAAVSARRAAMVAVDRLSASRSGRLRAGLHALDARSTLWLMATGDAEQRALVLTPQQWFAAVMEVARAGALFEWPARVEPVFGSPMTAALATVPGIVDLRHRHAGLAADVWTLPVLTGLLATAFGFAFVQQRRAARREAQAMAAQAQFLTTVTHELKTPLAGIRLLGEMLAEGRAHGREREYYRLLVGEAARLSLLIDNVLDLGRLERGERDYTRRTVVLGEVVRDALRLFGPVLEQAHLEVAFRDEVGDARVRLDRDAFVQAFVAVLDNARKYGGAGGHVDVHAEVVGDRLQVAVRDRGDGVPEDERERVFDRFVRGTAHRHGSTPGVGIGLYLARQITRRLGGELACVAPVHGAGAEFRFTFQREVAR